MTLPAKVLLVVALIVPALAFAQNKPAPPDTQTAPAPAPSMASHDDPGWTLAFPTPKEITPPKAINGACEAGGLPGRFDPSNIGATVIAFHVMTDGSVQDAKVDQSSGANGLDQAALSCVRQFKYAPATYNFVPVEVTRKFKINWSLPR